MARCPHRAVLLLSLGWLGADVRADAPAECALTAGQTQAVLAERAEAGDGAAMFGLACRAGWTEPKDPQLALQWLQRAADHGNAHAQLLWAGVLLGPANYQPEQARLFLLAAAKQGHPVARMQLGMMALDQGDTAEAVRWLRAAAEVGDREVQMAFAQMLADGEAGIPVDLAEATRWRRSAAERGQPSGQLVIGLAYRDGLGLPRDPVEALFWLLLAAPAEPRARAAANALSPTLNNESRNRVQRRVRQWRPQSDEPQFSGSIQPDAIN